MSIRFIYGRAGSGKSYYCLQSIKKRIEENENRNLILLVPEQFSFQAEKNLLKSVGQKGMLKAQVLSFKRAAERVFGEVGGGTRKHVNDSGKAILLYEIIERNKRKLKVFGKSTKKQGFVNMISDMITELKKYDISLKLLQDSLDRIENINLKNKLEDIIIIYSEFQERLHKNYIDSEDILSLLYEKLDISNFFNNAEVWIDEFYSFTPQEYKVLEKIMCKSYRTNITLCTDILSENSSLESMDLFLPTQITEKKILEIAKNNNIAYDSPKALKSNSYGRFKGNAELAHLERYIFSYPYKTYKSLNSSIRIFKALNKYTEVENSARDILKMCRDEGFRFRDISVVTGDLDGYENIIKAVFNQYNIPYFIDKKREIDDSPIIILIISAVEILSKNWSYESIFRYLKTGLLNLEFDEIDMLENYVLANGIRGKKWIDPKPWNYRINYGNFNEEISEEEAEYLKKINCIRDKVREPILKLSEDIKGKKTGQQMCEGLYNFLLNLEVPEKVEALIKEFRNASKLDKANEYSQIWNIVMDILDQIAVVIGDESIGMELFSEVLVNGFSQYKIGVIPASLDQVLVSSVTRLRSHDVRILYIVGVNDGIFPASISLDGVFTDEDRDELRKRGMELAKDTRSRAFEEQLLVYGILTKADKYLTLSYSMSDEEGKSKRQSIVISIIKKLFPKLQEESNLKGILGEKAGIEAVNGPKDTFNELISNIRRSIEDNNSVDPLWINVYRWYKNDTSWSKKVETVLKGFSYNNYIEILDKSKVRGLYGKHLNISVSRLEKFSECPFAYFVKYGLKVEDRKMYNLSSPDLGSFMHDILKKFSIQLKEKKLTWNDIDKNWCEENVKIVVDSTLNGISGSILNSSKKYKHITDNLKKILTRSVWLIAEHMKRGKFVPRAYELSFGESGDIPPISIKLHSGEEVSLIGRVDRIDLLEQNSVVYVRIIDYKSGTKEFKLSDIYYGFQMQLLIYLDAILAELDEKFNKEGIPGGILYFKLDDPIIKTEGNISDSEIEKRILKSLRMNGLLLNDPDVIRQMDSKMEKASDIICASVKKDGNLSKVQSSLATRKQFELLRKYVRSTIVDLSEKILKGDIEAAPYKNKSRTGCSYCIYSAICQFDTSIKGNEYKILRDKKDEEVWKDIEGKVGK
ncbi:helicase-exonuclease AddAB subunit AddB [Clostridium sp. AWRP]|uniref:helicase-exonuclease AddAB subunit AddB n=1 Tax=Clostridium sp. AWRP TaxID=2212991 RepID=UPI000FD7CB94|nr:helicase-exonuclease AddAB subunit AddB [Clostridium sp. AWRP]AZV55698.1 helicase-exonuclease AddAB subunit AddB [Clostridium sp. AWRP]